MTKNSKTNTKKLSTKEYEQLGRQIEAIYDSVNPKKVALYKAAFIKGILGGVGGVIGATVVVALLLWFLSLFGSLPIIGGFLDTVQNTIESGPTNQ